MEGLQVRAAVQEDLLDALIHQLSTAALIGGTTPPSSNPAVLSDALRTVTRIDLEALEDLRLLQALIHSDAPTESLPAAARTLLDRRLPPSDRAADVEAALTRGGFTCTLEIPPSADMLPLTQAQFLCDTMGVMAEVLTTHVMTPGLCRVRLQVPPDVPGVSVSHQPTTPAEARTLDRALEPLSVRASLLASSLSTSLHGERWEAEALAKEPPSTDIL